MKKTNVVAIRPRKRHYYPKTGLMFKKAKNLLNREFEQQSINTHWVGDITYIKTYKGWSYLSGCVGFRLKTTSGLGII